MSNGFIVVVVYFLGLRCEFIIEIGVMGLRKWNRTTDALGNTSVLSMPVCLRLALLFIWPRDLQPCQIHKYLEYMVPG